MFVDYIYHVVVLHIDPFPDCITEVFFDNPETVVLRCISAGAHPWPDFKWFLQDKEITDKNKETSSIHGLGAPVGCKGQKISEGVFQKKRKKSQFLPKHLKRG